ncbi:MAG TPA: hypothetical protein VGW38_25635, partial [Chloroflexota bacterium]|nr:hypothetical protein [Chloroflexota bacterium]
SFLGVATDDLIRYWAIADGLLSGTGYPVTTGEAGSGGFYLVELPVYPVLAATSLWLVGHRFIALMVPLAIAHAVLPSALFLLARVCGAGRLSALWLALAVVSFPQYQIYALGAPEPEPLLALWITLALYLTIRRLTALGDAWHRRALLEWAGAGAFAALAILTRPEGILYAGALFLGIGAFSLHRLLRLGISNLSPALVWQVLRGPSTAAIIFALPVLGFVSFLSRTFGILWPTGWTNVAGPQFIPGNYRLVVKQNLPYYAETSGLPNPALTGPLIAFVLCILLVVGLVRLCAARPALSFIAVGLSLNLAVIFASPTYLTLDLFSPPTFFRHLSVLFPWLLPAGAALALLLRRWVQSTSRFDAASMSASLLVVLVAELTVLGIATARDQAQIPTIFTQDPFVLMTDLWQANDDLPQLPFVRSGERAIATIDPSFNYLEFRSRLFASVRPYDLHFNDAGRAYVLATGVLSVAAIVVLTWTRLGKRA